MLSRTCSLKESDFEHQRESADNRGAATNANETELWLSRRPVNVLIVHQNFPGQFGRLSDAFTAREGWKVVGLGRGLRDPAQVGQADYVHYDHPSLRPDLVFPPLHRLGEEIRLGRSAADELWKVKRRGFTPDAIIAHPGWGDALFVRDVFPKARLISYMEYFYNAAGSDIDFDPEFPISELDRSFVRFRNVPTMLAFEDADACITPTEWQRQQFPRPVREHLSVLHDGIPTGQVRPQPKARYTLRDGQPLDRTREIITFVARSLEPYRGFHVLMRALPDLLRRRRKAVVLIVGGDDVSYGRSPASGRTWRQSLLDEVGGDIDPSRVHFLGRIAYADYLNVLAVSTVHIYLTYPFVLSWSLLEAMSTSCAVVASKTGPVREVVEDGINGRLVDFFDRAALVDTVAELADDGPQRDRLGAAARRTVVEKFDFDTAIYPRFRTLLA